MTLFLLGLGLLLVGGVSAVVSRRGTALYQGLVVAGSTLAALVAAQVLATGTAASFAIAATTPGGEWRLGIDALSAVFLIVTLGVGSACAVFGANDLAGSGRSVGYAHAAFAVLVAAIAMVIAARSVLVFLSAWEIMAISSYVLIVLHDEDAKVRRAGLIYIVATHTATLALFVMFAIWTRGAEDWTFDAMAAAAPALGAGAVAAILVLALVGFGFKAGSVPLHFWLPPAHAAAPSHVSALMSGVVIKTGIYGLLRVVLLLGGAPAWWGWTVLGIGLASSVLGVLWALAQHDIKRLLAYHSVENIGIIMIGIGVGVLGAASGSPTVAIIGFGGGILHTVNHALFKSLLFLGAGAVYHATGTRNMEELGGLARRMPFTWVGFVIGAAAIIGVPPFNGFVSEWLVFQGLFRAGLEGGLLRLALVGIPLLALTGGLALACFAKVAGVVFLGTPRSPRTSSATDATGGARWAMLMLAAVCVALGVVPLAGMSFVWTAAADVSAGRGTGAAEIPSAVVAGAEGLAVVAVITIALTGLLWWTRRAIVRRQSVRHDVTWGCGYDAPTPRMQYTASSFAAPLLAVFGPLSGVRAERTADSLHTRADDLVLDRAAIPLWNALHRGAERLRVMQQGRGRLHIYFLFVMAALLALLTYLTLGARP